MWRNVRLHRKLAFGTYWLDKICNRCSDTNNICVHHIDENPDNNSIENFEILCASCHTRLHKLWSTPWNKWKKWNRDYIHSEEVKNKISESCKGREAWNKWKVWLKTWNKWLSIWPNIKLRWRKKTVDWIWYSEWIEKKMWTRKDFYSIAI